MFEKNQKFLSLIYGIKNNNSRAVYGIKNRANEILDIEQVDFDYETRLYYYKNKPPNNKKIKEINKGGRPSRLTEEQKQDILFDERGHTEVAKIYKVSEKYIRLIRKGER